MKDLSEIKGNANIKRIIEIAAAGNFNVLLLGPMSSGKRTLIKILAYLKTSCHKVPKLDDRKSYNCGCRLQECECKKEDRVAFRRHIYTSARCDLFAELQYPTFEQLASESKLETTEIVLNRIVKNHIEVTYSDMTLSRECESLLKTAYSRLGLAPFDFFKIKEISRVIANLEKANQIQAAHVAEAIQYRIFEI